MVADIQNYTIDLKFRGKQDILSASIHTIFITIKSELYQNFKTCLLKVLSLWRDENSDVEEASEAGSTLEKKGDPGSDVAKG